MTLERPYVVIATVPWRLRSLRVLLQDLVKQTLLPAHLDLLFDRYLPSQKSQLTPEVDALRNAGCEVDLQDSDPQASSGARWIFLARKAYEAPVMVLDDDLSVEPEYCAWTLQEMKRQNADAASYHGSTFSMEPFHWKNSYAPEEVDSKPLLIIAGGVSAFRKGALIAPLLERQDDIKTFLMNVGFDDYYMSYFLWSIGARIYRPSGRWPGSEQPESFDRRSIRFMKRADTTAYGVTRRLLEEKYRWPTCVLARRP